MRTLTIRPGTFAVEDDDGPARPVGGPGTRAQQTPELTVTRQPNRILFVAA
jgi:hypothetical protein